MLYGVHIDMSFESSLTTVALLSAYTENTNNHYLDLLVPFVEYCIPSSEGEILDYKNISLQLGTEFGIVDMPEKIVAAIVKRYAKSNPEAIAKQSGSTYVVCKKPSNADFDQRRRSIQQQMTTVTDKFDVFLSTQPWKKPEKDAKALLLDFFQSYGLTVVRNVEELHLVSSTNDRDLFIVAKFILWAHENDELLFESLIDLTKGFLTYRAIYQIDEGDKQDHMSKLRSVKCFLDCSLLISLLGYDTQESQNSVQGLIQMLQKNGGRIYVFDHTIDEAKYLLMSYADSSDKLRFRLPGIKAKHLSDAVIRTQALALDKTVRSHGITPLTVSEDEVAKERNNSATSFSSLYECLANGYRREYDFKSIVGIKNLRNGSHPLQIENCIAVLVTQDLRLAYSIRKFTLCTLHEVSLAKLDTDMIAMLWLQTFTACPEMPKDILLSNAAAAVTLSDDVRKRAIELTDMWVKDGSMDPSMAQLLRSDRLDELLIVDCTANDPEALNLENIKSVVMQALTPEIEAEKEKIRVQERAEYERKIEAVTQDNAQQKAQEELAQQQQQKETERKRLIEKSRRINNKAQNIANRVRAFVQRIGFVVFIVFIAALSIYQGIDMYKAYSTAETSVAPLPWLEWIGRILLIIVAIYGTITTFLDGKFTVRRLLNMLERKVYDIAYGYYDRQAKEWDI